MAKTDKNENVIIKLPVIPGAEDEWVSINDRTWQIQRGVEVEVPRCVAKVLECKEREQLREMAYIEQITKPKK